MCAIRSATASSIRSVRHSPIGKQGGGPVHLTHFYHRPIYPGPVEQLIGLVEDARAAGSGRDLGRLSLRVGLHAPPHPAAPMGPGGRPGRDARAHRRSRDPQPDPGRDGAARSRLCQRQPLRQHPPGLLLHAPVLEVGGPHHRRLHPRDGRGRRRCHLRHAHRRRPAPQPGHQRTHDREPGAVPGRTRSRCSAPTPRSWATSPRRGPMARFRACWASSCARSG